MLKTRAVVVLLGAVALMGGAAAQTNLEQARQGIAQLQQRIGAFRVQLEHDNPSTKHTTSTGVFDGKRYRQTCQQEGIPGETGWKAARESHFCYDGQKAISYYIHIDSPPIFCIRPRPDSLLPSTYSFAFFDAPFKDVLARPDVKELESKQVGDVVCVGFEASAENAKSKVREVKRLWLDPANSWFPRRVEILSYTLDDPPQLADAWIYETTRIGLDAKGVPYAAETAVYPNYKRPDYKITVTCSLYETGVPVTDDMFTMAPPPGAKVIDDFAHASYTAGQAPDTAGLMPDETADARVTLPESAAAAEKQPGVQGRRPRQPEPASKMPGWLVQLLVTAGLAVVTGAGLAIAVRRARRRGPKAD